MKIRARMENSKDNHQVKLQTNDNVQSINIPSKPTGYGSSANGGGLLFLALASCYCAEGERAKNVTYRAKVFAQAGEDEIRELMKSTDTVAEIQNTMRTETPVILTEIEAVKI